MEILLLHTRSALHFSETRPPQAYLADVLSRIATGHLNTRLDDLLPWAYATAPDLKAVA
jgi:hypothetical protein